MITVKAKKQTELASRRKNRPAASTNGHKQNVKGENMSMDVISMESASPSPRPAPLSPKPSSEPTYIYEYHPSDQTMPKPFQLNRMPLPLSQSAQVNQADISDIFLAQTRRIKPYLFALPEL